MKSKNPELRPYQQAEVDKFRANMAGAYRPGGATSNNHPEDQASIEAMHQRYVSKLDALNDDLMNFQDDAYALGRSRGLKEGEERRVDMLKALAEARDVIATALKSSAPDWFKTDAEIAQHVTIARIDTVIAKAGVK